MNTTSRPDETGYQNLLARQEIHDALLRYCWGIDRANLDLVLSAFHEDALDNHSGVEESAVERFTRTVVQGASMLTSHNISNILIQVDGSRASSQCNLTAWHQFEHDGCDYDWVINGRYLDRFECRNGQWRIIHRTVVYDSERFHRLDDRPKEHPATKFFDHVVRGQKSQSDYSFQILRT